MKNYLQYIKEQTDHTDIDPYGEEEWPENYDIIFDEIPGLEIKHEKGDDYNTWIIIIKNRNELTNYIDITNPEWNIKRLGITDQELLIGIIIGRNVESLAIKYKGNL